MCAVESVQEKSSDTPKNRKTLQYPMGVHGMSSRPIREQWLKFDDESATSMIKMSFKKNFFYVGLNISKVFPSQGKMFFLWGKKSTNIWILLSAMAYLLTVLMYVVLFGSH